MSQPTPTRRDFLKTSATIASAAAAPYFWTSAYAKRPDKNGRPILGMIGCGGKGRDDAKMASAFGDFAAVCDVDRGHADGYANNPALSANGARKIDVYEDYRKLLDRGDVDAVICATPDHWHTAVYVAALEAGKDVYGEKPMTLTVDEGKILRRVVHETGRVFQVGNQQRSCQWFREAVAIAQSGILGGKLTATCFIGKGPSGGPFQPADPPPGLNWDLWLGQAPYVPYMPQRCHGSFRWWLEYSGGKLTDWGAHHIDIAQWGLGALDTGPVEIEGEGVLDRRPNCYNTAQTFTCTLTFADGGRIVVKDGPDNGILFEGQKEHVFVNRRRLSGNLIDKLADDPAMSDRIRTAATRLYDGPYGMPDHRITDYTNCAGKTGWAEVKQSHMANFFRCIRDGARPISDVETVQRATTSCHLCNIAMLLGRKLRWDPAAEDFIGDAEATGMLAREQRKPYTIEA